MRNTWRSKQWLLEGKIDMALCPPSSNNYDLFRLGRSHASFKNHKLASERCSWSKGSIKYQSLLRAQEQMNNWIYECRASNTIVKLELGDMQQFQWLTKLVSLIPELAIVIHTIKCLSHKARLIRTLESYSSEARFACTKEFIKIKALIQNVWRFNKTKITTFSRLIIINLQFTILKSLLNSIKHTQGISINPHMMRLKYIVQHYHSMNCFKFRGSLELICTFLNFAA